MINYESRLRDLEEAMEDGLDGYMPFVRLRHEVREDFRLLRQNHKSDVYLIGHLKWMSSYITNSYELVPLGSQMQLLGQAISMGKLIEYEVSRERRRTGTAI